MNVQTYVSDGILRRKMVCFRFFIAQKHGSVGRKFFFLQIFFFLHFLGKKIFGSHFFGKKKFWGRVFFRKKRIFLGKIFFLVI